MNRYKTITKSGQFEFKEKGSKFIGKAIPIKNKEEVKAELDKIKKDFPKANHYCYAFQTIEKGASYYLSNDDGEPNNSAGMPILGQIRSFELHYVLVVVIRYFGGTKLGVGGLISAYKKASEGALSQAKIVEKKTRKILRFNTDYQSLGDVLALLDKRQIDYRVNHQNQRAYFELSCAIEEEETIIELFGPLAIKFD